MKRTKKRKQEEIVKAIHLLKHLEQTLCVNFNPFGPAIADLTRVRDYFSFVMTRQLDSHSLQLGYFGVLPNEIILRIFSFLDFKSLSNICCVCKHFQAIGEDDLLWQKLCDDNVTPTLIEFKPPEKNHKWLLRATKYETINSSYCGAGTQSIRKQRYFGDWKDGKKNGYGILFYDDIFEAFANLQSSIAYFSGHWVDDKRHGMGKRKWQNGNTYIGMYLENKRHGNGTFIFANGSEFIGSFRNNKFAHGIYTWNNGRIYDGDWDNTLRHGYGKYTWPDSRKYEGEWKNDKRDGHGKYTWPDGDEYEGEFVDGRRVGPGILKLKTGEVIRQFWREEQFEEESKGLNLISNEIVYPPTKRRKVEVKQQNLH